MASQMWEDPFDDKLAISRLTAQTLAHGSSSANVYWNNEYLHQVEPSQKCRWPVILVGQPGHTLTLFLQIHSLTPFPPFRFLHTPCYHLTLVNIYFFFFGCTCSMQKFPGQGSNLCHSSDSSHCSDNARSLINPLSYRGTPVNVFFMCLSSPTRTKASER